MTALAIRSAGADNAELILEPILEPIRALAAFENESDQDCARLDLWVLEWNPARRFHERLGIEHMAAWLPYRCAGEALQRLAKGGEPS